MPGPRPPWSSRTSAAAEAYRARVHLRGERVQAADRGELAAAITGHSVLDTGAAWQAMVRAVRNLGRPGLVSCAISAVDTALWDLKATLLGLPVQPAARGDSRRGPRLRQRRFHHLR